MRGVESGDEDLPSANDETKVNKQTSYTQGATRRRGMRVNLVHRSIDPSAECIMLREGGGRKSAFANQSIHRPVHQSVRNKKRKGKEDNCRSIDWSIDRLINQPMNPSIKRFQTGLWKFESSVPSTHTSINKYLARGTQRVR